jgi:hypothetical protein
MAILHPTGSMLEEFARRVEAEERERCARICEETFVEPGDMQVCNFQEAADKIRR